MTLLIDDQRDLDADLIARNYNAGLLVLEWFTIDYLKLDHDLGPGKTGYDIVLKLEEWHSRGEDHELPTTVELVTDNPVGMHKMAAALERIYPYSIGKRMFSKDPIK